MARKRLRGGRSSQLHNSCNFLLCFSETLSETSRAVDAAGDYSAGLILQIGPDSITTWERGHPWKQERLRSPAKQQSWALEPAFSDERGQANIFSFITPRRVAQSRTWEPHLLIFADGLVVFHNHIDAGGRVQQCSLQVKLQHLGQERAPDMGGG